MLELPASVPSGGDYRVPGALFCDSLSRLTQQRKTKNVQICQWRHLRISLLMALSCTLFVVASGCGANVAKTAATATIVASPNSIDFGTVSVGQTSTNALSLMNRSGTPVEVSELNTSGQPFFVSGQSNLPVTIGADGSYVMEVQFTPATTGVSSGQLTVSSNPSTNDDVVIALSGTGATAVPAAALSAVSCSIGSMTGSGSDSCTVTLSSAAPSDGLVVSLSSSNIAVKVPATVTVPANATCAPFTATVSSVGTKQADTVRATQGTVSEYFSLTLNAAIPALSINASNVAFGDVVVNTVATQSVTLTSTGNVPVIINTAALTGAGFTLSGASFPAALSPGQAVMLDIQFDPAIAGQASGQLTITSNSSTGSASKIGLSGTGTLAQAVVVTVTPSNASVIAGATQQFDAAVTETSDSAVTWTLSGAGCIGAVCGTISSSGVYTAPLVVPSSATVTITATSAAAPTQSASAGITVVPPQAAGYNLAWQDTFSTLNVCAPSVPDCNWYSPSLSWEPAPGEVSDPLGTYVNLQWTEGQPNGTTISTASPYGIYSNGWTFGYFEVSMAFNPAIGSFPGIWMLPTSEIGVASGSNGIAYGGLDMFEWQSQAPTTFYGTAHVWVDDADPVNNAGTSHWTVPAGTNFADYNNYGVLWTPTSISWYLNNVLMETLSTTSVSYNSVFGGSQSYFLILSDQAGCNWSANPCPGQVSPLNMQVQWVHVYAPPAN